MALSAGALNKISLPKVNPHVLGAGGLISVLALMALAVLMLGNPQLADGVKLLALPPAATKDAALRANIGHDEIPAALIASSKANQPGGEPSLPGVEDPQPESAVPQAPHQHAVIQAPANPEALPPTPVKALTAPGPGGLLPVIGPNGRRPSDVYARPFKTVANKPVIALIVGGLGLKKSSTLAAIHDLPPQVTLSFVPYTRNLQDWVNQARAAGHEVMIELPMEPFDYPQNDPGPQTLLAKASVAENTRRLEWLLSRATGYFAVTNYMGSRFTASESALAPVLRQLRQRGVDFIYDGETRRSSLRNVAAAEHLRWTVADRIVDTEPAAAAIDEQLLHLEALAIQNGSALGVGFSWPITMKRLKSWSQTLSQKGYMLAPASAVLRARTGTANISTLPHHAPQIAANTRH